MEIEENNIRHLGDQTAKEYMKTLILILKKIYWFCQFESKIIEFEPDQDDKAQSMAKDLKNYVNFE